MPQTKRTVKGVLSGMLGLVGLSVVAGILATAAVTPAIAVAGVTGSQALTLFDNLPSYLKPNAPMAPTTIYGNDGNGKPFVLATFYEQNRVPVKFDQVSPVLYDAVLSSEDKNFYSHGGVNLLQTAKAAIENFTGASSRGASTITQQYVKNALIQQCEQGVPPNDPDYEAKMRQCFEEAAQAKGADGIERKLQEMRFAVQVEKDYSKNEILLGYLNVSNFGGTTYGIEAAANRYFGTTAAKLTLVQAATLAGMVQEPNLLRIDRPEDGTWSEGEGESLVKHNTKEDGYATTKNRRDYVLGEMLENGQITKEEHAAAVETPVEPNLKQTTQGCAAAGDNAYFCQYAKSVMEKDEAFGATAAERLENRLRGGLKIYTSLDLRVQAPAVQAVHDRVPASMEGIKLGGAGVSIEASTGRILAIAQNTSFSEAASQEGKPGISAQVFAADRAHGGGVGFGPGSTYKLFTLLDWLEKGHSVNEVLDGRVRNFGKFPQCEGTYTQTEVVGNFGQGRGSVSSVRRFTSASLNTGFLAMAQQLNLCDINKMAKRLGVHWGDGGDVTTYGVGPEGKLADSAKDGVRTDANDPFPTVLGSKSIAPIQMAGAYATVANKGIFCEPRVIDKIVGQDGKEMPVPKTTCTQAISPEVAATAAYALRGVMEGGTGSGANPYDGIQVIGKTGTAEKEHTMLVESSTKVATAVWVGNITGDKDLKAFSAHGTRLNDIRYPLARDLQRAANNFYGGDRFPDPDPNLTRRVLKDLPDVTGKSIEEAEQILEKAGFSVQVGDEVDSTHPKGTVAEQDPGAGRVAGGTTVTLRPSSGKAPEAETGGAVPNVVGAKYALAKTMLEAMGYGVDDEGCRGGSDVTEQNPAAGTPAPAGSTVALKCADGQE
ncbi:transglycosylase domain-containing protein [Microbacterium sp. H1-D42]|uniref:transglycosylase domain-containing protein n=1 Tax=Microbacterium sp. H1-D42 TaxID=2925844 RepID=UPI001F538841|nr:transglycosylase domain-containing protein [Microbacterium sp. H1-D42]UNK71718.1 transglycosylase domain-containing protein [Microbacterium sp. H1-D42]